MIALFVSAFGFGQFKATADGYQNSEDASKDFIVSEFTSKSKSDLFTAAKKHITAEYVGIKNDGYNEVENEQIVLDMKSTTSGGSFINNRFEINFKDGKIMIKPTFKYYDSDGQLRGLRPWDIGAVSLYKKDGTPRDKVIPIQLEKSVNTFVQGLIKSIGSEPEW